MTDAQLANIAIEDGHKLTAPAFRILKEEFAKRNLDNSPIAAAENNRQEMQEQEIQELRESAPEKYETAIWEYLFEEKEKNTPETEIVAGLCTRAVKEEDARNMIANTEDKINEIISRHDKRAALSGFIAFAGILLTVFTFTNAALHGGTYIVAWGAIVFGIYDYFQSAKKRKNYQLLLVNIKKHSS